MRKRDGKRQKHQLSQKLTPRLPVGTGNRNACSADSALEILHNTPANTQTQIQTETNIYNHTLTQTFKQTYTYKHISKQHYSHSQTT